jgi:4-oxalocrotonate tautomerase
MPILNVKVSARKSPEMTHRISAILLDLTSRILGKDPRVTSIAIDYVDPDDWIVGGRSLSEQGKSSIYFDVKVTDETNTKAEKAQYISEAFSLFQLCWATFMTKATSMFRMSGRPPTVTEAKRRSIGISMPNRLPQARAPGDHCRAP